MSQRSHDRWNLEMKGGRAGGGEGERRGERGGVRAGEGKGGRPVLFGPMG